MELSHHRGKGVIFHPSGGNDVGGIIPPLEKGVIFHPDGGNTGPPFKVEYSTTSDYSAQPL